LPNQPRASSHLPTNMPRASQVGGAIAVSTSSGIRVSAKAADAALTASTKSERAEADCAAPMGRGATATIERLAASIGQLDEANPRFEAALDIPRGGVLLALPALMLSGLLRHADKYFRLPAGFYGLKTIFLLLALMALARVKSIEALRYCSPGEWG